ncbi:MAG: RDD family protein, partial [Thermoproteota archaeon]|nr:RDD family protein [Thermoproteota archaeon]
VGVSGQTVNVRDALLESFGKSFLLPIDLILGWIFTNDKRQRIFNRASNTIVIKLRSHTEENSSSNVRYRKDN